MQRQICQGTSAAGVEGTSKAVGEDIQQIEAIKERKDQEGRASGRGSKGSAPAAGSELRRHPTNPALSLQSVDEAAYLHMVMPGIKQTSREKSRWRLEGQSCQKEQQEEKKGQLMRSNASFNDMFDF